MNLAGRRLNMSDEQVERIVVTVLDDQGLAEIQSVATALQTAGMKVDNVMPITGIITGEVPRSKRQKVECVPGVHVEDDREMRAI
jgi:methylmalonyl-CoA mutase cobalamin-binding subunit